MVEAEATTSTELEGIVTFDAGSGWLRSTDFTTTITAVFPMGIRGAAWTQTDKSVTTTRSNYTLARKPD